MLLIQPCPSNIYPGQQISFNEISATLLGQSYPHGCLGILITCTVAAYIEIGETPTASATSLYIPANTPMPVVVPTANNGAFTVSVLGVSTSGTCYINAINNP